MSSKKHKRFINPLLILVGMAKKKDEGKEAVTSKAEPLSAKDKSLSISDQAIQAEKCDACNVSLVNDTGAVKFPCPNCGKSVITRCSKCRKIVAKYRCPLCGFEGPN